MNKRGLGRGLGALLSSAPGDEDSLLDISVDQVDPNPNQPRKAFDSKALDELAASVKTSGLIQPIVVRRSGERFQINAGERRWRAARQAGLHRVPAIVREVTDAESLELALVENLLREDLNPMEEADAYQKLLAQFGWTQEELAQRVGKDRSSIANCLRLLRLPEAIQADLRGGRLTMGHARSLLTLGSEAEQLRLRDEILAHSWSVRATEDTVRAAEAGAPKRPGRKPGRRRSIELAALEESVQQSLQTRVRIIGNERKGKIEIVYATPDELERLATRLGAE